MDWSYFIYFAAPALFCWIGGAWLAYRPSFSKGAVAWTVFGLAIFSAFIIGMWISLEMPPLRTMVRSARDSLYVLLRHAGRRCPYRHLPADPCEEEGD